MYIIHNTCIYMYVLSHLSTVARNMCCLDSKVVSSVSLPEIEARIQQELEQKMKTEFEEKERRLQEEHLLKLEREKHDKEEQLRLRLFT